MIGKNSPKSTAGAAPCAGFAPRAATHAPNRAGPALRIPSRLRPSRAAPSRAGFTFTLSMVLIALTLISAASFAQEWRKSQQASTTKVVSAENLRGRIGSDVRSMIGAGAKVSTDNTTGATTLSFSLTQPFKREGDPIAQVGAYSTSLPSNLRNLGYEAILSANSMSGSNATVIVTSNNGSLVNNNAGAYDITTFYQPQGMTPSSIVANIFCNKQAKSVGDLVISGSANANTGGSGCTAGGGTVSVMNGYCIHTFTSSGTFTPGASGNVEVLVVAGGGAGGTDRGGGGGAGGLIYNPYYAVSSPVTVTVGAGGTKSTVDSANGGSGGNSVFGTLSAIGGGGGGSENTAYGSSGGSGGGNAYPGTGAGGAGTSGQGTSGGSGVSNYPTSRATGGGGGAGGAGIGSGSVPNGGVGLSYSISGSAVYYAGGGGGGSATLGGGGPGAGAGGLGGGGNGGPVTGFGSDAIANTGGGGGGGGSVDSTGQGGNGGSGIVIVRYPLPSTAQTGYYYFVNYTEPGGRNYIRNYFAPLNSTATMTVKYPDNSLLYFESIFSPNAAQNRTSIHYTKSSAGALILPFNTNDTGIVRDYSLFKENVTLANGSNAPAWQSDCSNGGCYYFNGSGQYMYVPGGVELTGAQIPLPLGKELFADPWFEALAGNSSNLTTNDGLPDTWVYWGTYSNPPKDVVEAVSGSGAQSYISARVGTTLASGSMARIYNYPAAQVSPSTAYTLSFWAKDSGSPGRYSVQVNNTCLTTNGTWTTSCVPLLAIRSPTYVQNYAEFVTPSGTGALPLTVTFYAPSTNGAAYYDSASLKQSNGINGGFENYYAEGSGAGPAQ